MNIIFREYGLAILTVIVAALVIITMSVPMYPLPEGGAGTFWQYVGTASLDGAKIAQKNQDAASQVDKQQFDTVAKRPAPVISVASNVDEYAQVNLGNQFRITAARTVNGADGSTTYDLTDQPWVWRGDCVAPHDQDGGTFDAHSMCQGPSSEGDAQAVTDSYSPIDRGLWVSADGTQWERGEVEVTSIVSRSDGREHINKTMGTAPFNGVSKTWKNGYLGANDLCNDPGAVIGSHDGREGCTASDSSSDPVGVRYSPYTQTAQFNTADTYLITFRVKDFDNVEATYTMALAVDLVAK